MPVVSRTIPPSPDDSKGSVGFNEASPGIVPIIKTSAPNRSSSSSHYLNFTLKNIIYFLPFLITYTHVILSPHTKVEETPALHAIHDILSYGIGMNKLTLYDHVNYQGPVPRSLIPSCVISMIVYPLSLVLQFLGVVTSKLDLLILIRLVICTLFSISLVHFTKSVESSFSTSTGIWFILLSITQFHIPYYAGRTLPNFLALPSCLYAFSILLRGFRLHDQRQLLTSIGILSFTSTVIRLEIAPITVILAITLISLRRLSVLESLKAGAIGGFLGLAMSSTIDQYFYYPTSHPIKFWPELSAFTFNIVNQKASDWGISPWSYYLVNGLPKLALFAGPLAVVGTTMAVLERRRNRFKLLVFGILIIIGGAQIGAMSFVGHKEWRFVVYSVPLINLIAAEGAKTLWSINNVHTRFLFRFGLIGMIAGQILSTSFSTYVSMLNYPGSDVGSMLQTLPEDSKIWIPAAALHTGATLFTLPTLHPKPKFSAIPIEKSPNLTLIHPESAYERCTFPFGNSPVELWNEGYNYAITDDVDSFELIENGHRWRLVNEIQGYQSVNLGKTWPFLNVRIGRKLGLMQSLGSGESV